MDLETRRALAVMRSTVTRLRSTGQTTTTLALIDKPRHFQQAMTSIAVGTTTVAASWSVPIDGDYTVIATIIGAAANVGLLTAAQQPGSQTPTSCTVIVSNRTAGQIAAAVLDVLIHPV